MKKADPNKAGSGSHPKTASGVPIGDDHLPCVGSGVIHAQVMLRILRGRSGVLFIRCPLPECRELTFLGGPGYKERLEKRGRIGLTKTEILALNSNALIL